MKLINRAADCTIKTFISCKFDKRLELLVIDGKPSPNDLLQAFEEIETEYNDLCGNVPDELIKINKVNELTARNAAVQVLFFAVDECLRRANVPLLDALPRLKKQGINIKWNNDIDDFKKQVAGAKIREKTNTVRLEELNKELQEMQKVSVKSPSFTRKDFYRLKQSIQSLLGHQISETETNMYEYGVMCFNHFDVIKNQKPN